MNIRPWVTAVAVAVLLTGCAAGPGPTVATARTATAAPAGTGSAGASPTAEESDYDKALRYTRCMNDNGERVPDPVEGKPLPLGEEKGGWTGASAAFEKCKQFMPDTWPVRADPKETAREARFNECMRRNGFPPPEPDVNGMIHYPTGKTSTETPELDAAVAKCRYLLDDPANNLPENK